MKKVVLIILDGWGIAPAWGGNAIEMAETPNMDGLWKKYPHLQLKAAEEAVGLPHHEPGNSEVGHLNIGSGQIVYQNLPGITETIKDGSFFKNEVLLGAVQNVKEHNSNLHLLGLVSDGGVHAYIGHLFALLDMAKQNNLQNVYIHMITDGRDTDPMKALSYLAELNQKIKEVGVGKVESVMGRYWAMDRDKHWERTEKAYDALTSGLGGMAESAERAISENYRKNMTDEFINPTVIASEQSPFVPISDNDSVIFFNYRAERTRQLTDALGLPNFSKFGRRKVPKNLYFATFAFLEEYVGNDGIKIVFHHRKIDNPIAKVISDAKLKQFHTAETEKYAHVTFFFNGSKEEPFPGENRALVPSPRIATYDLKPEMSADGVTSQVLSNFKKYDFTVANFANPDMVGHTGKIKAAIRACEKVDECLGKISAEVIKSGAVLMVTADHGNVEQMLNPNTGEPYTEHTINPVPFILCAEDPVLQQPLRMADSDDPLKLSDIAPTIIDIMELNKPEEMTGKSLFVRR